jgi:hypothetical protein
MSRNKPIQSDAQNLGDVGETTVQLILQKYNWTADIIKSDFGEDIDCNVFIDNTRTNYHLRCQVKSTTKDSEYVKKLKNGDYSVSISSGLLKAWLSSYFPVFLIVYVEDSDSCYWTIPTKQILDNPAKLEKDNPSIRVSKKNVFNKTSKEQILKEVKDFYYKILRLDESTIECRVTPILMPNYRVIPFHNYSDFIHKKELLKADIAAEFVELLPSWMTVLKRLEPSNALTSIKLSSTNPDLDEFLDKLKQKLKTFNYQVKDGEWISFIVSPIKIVSNSTSWISELTYWTSYTKFGNDIIVSDYDYNFEVPEGFLGQVSRRARSWDYFHFVHPKKDIAIQFFGGYEVTPSIQNIDKIHDKSIKGQLILWECEKHEIEEISNLLPNFELVVQLIDDSKDICLIAITTPMFDPFMGLYSVAMDWDSFENGNVRNKLEKYNLLMVLPGNEYKGKIPDFLDEALNRHSNNKYTKALVTEMEYISGFPMMHDERRIQVSRFQMVKPELINDIEDRLKVIKPIDKNDFQIDFGLQDDSMWQIPIYELTVSWTPDIQMSSKNEYLNFEKELLNIFNEVLPTNNDSSLQLKNTFEILHIAGEIGFEKNNEG